MYSENKVYALFLWHDRQTDLIYFTFVFTYTTMGNGLVREDLVNLRGNEDHPQSAAKPS